MGVNLRKQFFNIIGQGELWALDFVFIDITDNRLGMTTVINRSYLLEYARNIDSIDKVWFLVRKFYFDVLRLTLIFMILPIFTLLKLSLSTNDKQ